MDEPKQLITRFVEELWDERRLDVADAIFAEDCVPRTHSIVRECIGDYVLIDR